MSAHQDGRHVSTNRFNRLFWARTCPECALRYSSSTGLLILRNEYQP